MAGMLKNKGVAGDRLTVTPPWADGRRLYPLDHGENRFRREIGISGDHLVVMYSGNMGLGHRFETILAAARAMASNDKIHFVFIGEGARKPQIDAWRRRHHLGNVMMLPYQPRERLRETLSAGDVHLISLDAQVQGYIVPSKLAGILAVGRPVIFLGAERNSIAAAILGAQCGHVIPEGDVSRLVDLIEGLMENSGRRRRLGDAARNLFDREYDRAIVVPRIIATIEAKQHESQILKWNTIT
jgi:glycosyltransferase involved in cell wall biosynthesis